MSLSLSPNSLYRQTTDCTEGGGLTREHCTLSEELNVNMFPSSSYTYLIMKQNGQQCMCLLVKQNGQQCMCLFVKQNGQQCMCLFVKQNGQQCICLFVKQNGQQCMCLFVKQNGQQCMCLFVKQNDHNLSFNNIQYVLSEWGKRYCFLQISKNDHLVAFTCEISSLKTL
jgi:hypothetical protein